MKKRWKCEYAQFKDGNDDDNDHDLFLTTYEMQYNINPTPRIL